MQNNYMSQLRSEKSINPIDQTVRSHRSKYPKQTTSADRIQMKAIED